MRASDQMREGCVDEYVARDRGQASCRFLMLDERSGHIPERFLDELITDN